MELSNRDAICRVFAFFFIFFRTFREYNWKQLDLTYFY